MSRNLPVWSPRSCSRPAIASARRSSRLPDHRVVGNLLTDSAFLGIVAVGTTFVIISGGIDLSVGSVVGFTTVFLALAIERWGIPPSPPSRSCSGPPPCSAPRWAR